MMQTTKSFGLDICRLINYYMLRTAIKIYQEVRRSDDNKWDILRVGRVPRARAGPVIFFSRLGDSGIIANIITHLDKTWEQ